MLDETLGATPEETVEEQPKSMDDTIRETLRSLQEKSAEVPTDAPLDAEQKAQRIRDDAGKFKATEAEQVASEPEVPVKVAPNTWKKEVADKWSTLPPEVQAEVERREADFHKGIEQYRTAATFGQSMERAIAPHMATLQSIGIAPERAVAELMAADQRLRSGSQQEKSAYLAQLAQSYGIDLGQVQALPQIDPNLNAVQQELQKLRSQFDQQTLLGQQQAEASLNSEIAAFAADPKHSHFDAVRGHMSALLQAGQAKDLSDAYEQAIYANPTTRGAVLQQQDAAKRDEAAKKAQVAKQAASVNVRSRPSMPVSQPIGSMDDTIRATLRRLQGA